MDKVFQSEGQLIAALTRGEEAAFAYVFKQYYAMLLNYASRLLHDAERLQFVVPAVLSRQKQRLESCERGIRLAQPERVLKLGFSLTLKDGKAVTDASQLSSGDRIVTRLSNGEVTSRVE